jgi:phosphoenolpyruvate---glycerone phosphotransferase subunit DhaM
LVGIVLVSHSSELASGLARLAAEVAGEEVRIEPAGGGPEGSLGTSADTVKAAIERADQGQGVLVLGDLGSSILTVRSLLAEESNGTNGHIKFADAPFVEGAVAAAVVASAGLPLSEVVKAAEDTRGLSKL